MADSNTVTRCSVGIAVGKFNPPHLGHLHLIETAASMVDRLFVLLCVRSNQVLTAEQRKRWLIDASPDNVTIIVTPDDLPAENEVWARRALELLPQSPDIAFTSEAWGPGWARLMDAEHHLVDLERTTRPISATALRTDLGANFHWLVPAARAELARRVVLVGAESTGKTTLASALAEATASVWVPEHGRWYWEGRRHRVTQEWTTDEFRRIATAQRRLEADLARLSTDGIVICDTDALCTAVWHERYLGTSDTELDRLANDTPPALYLICGDEIDWVQDGTRESRAHRADMQRRIEERVRATGVPAVHLRGGHDERLASALAAIRDLVALPDLSDLVEPDQPAARGGTR